MEIVQCMDVVRNTIDVKRTKGGIENERDLRTVDYFSTLTKRVARVHMYLAFLYGKDLNEFG